MVTLGVEPVVYPDPNLGDPIPEDEAADAGDAKDAGEAAVEIAKVVENAVEAEVGDEGRVKKA